MQKRKWKCVREIQTSSPNIQVAYTVNKVAGAKFKKCFTAPSCWLYNLDIKMFTWRERGEV